MITFELFLRLLYQTLPLTQKNDLSLQKAVEVAGLNWVGRAHSGVDDAHNAANLLWAVLRRLRD